MTIHKLKTAYQTQVLQRFMTPSEIQTLNNRYNLNLKINTQIVISDRDREITNYLKTNRKMSIVQLARHFSVSEYTILRSVVKVTLKR